MKDAIAESYIRSRLSRRQIAELEFKSHGGPCIRPSGRCRSLTITLRKKSSMRGSSSPRMTNQRHHGAGCAAPAECPCDGLSFIPSPLHAARCNAAPGSDATRRMCFQAACLSCRSRCWRQIRRCRHRYCSVWRRKICCLASISARTRGVRETSLKHRIGLVASDAHDVSICRNCIFWPGFQAALGHAGMCPEYFVAKERPEARST